MRSALLIIVMLMLAACAGEPQTIHQRIYVRQQVPLSLLTCAPWPAPDPVPADLAGLVRWLAQGRAAWADCSDRLGRINELVDQDARAK